jgi:DNA-binding GntR family transcriptional regulator
LPKGRTDISAPTVPAGTDTTSVQRCADAIRHLILVGELLPGQTLRHVALAERLGTSRIPVREALNKLEADGVVTYVPRVGHAVARLSSEELSEIYLMRQLLEGELLRTADLSQADPAHLTALNQELAGLTPEELWTRKRVNRQFHFHLFACSPLAVVRREVARLWDLSELYRSLYAYEADSQRQIVADHRRIIAAVRAKDHGRLVAASDQHRHRAESAISTRLGLHAH